MLKEWRIVFRPAERRSYKSELVVPWAQSVELVKRKRLWLLLEYSRANWRSEAVGGASVGGSPPGPCGKVGFRLVLHYCIGASGGAW